MKRKMNLFWLLYLILVFYPTGILITVINSIITILFSFVGDYRWCYMPAKYWGRILCFLAFVRVKTKGQSNYCPKESYIFIANHQGFYDIFVIYGWLFNRFKWIMKNSLRKIPFVGLACHKAGHIFIDRSNPVRAKKSMEEAEKKLQNGSSVVIFAEGSRTKNGKLGNFKRGAFKIAEDLKLPIVPISIKGAYEIMPRGSYYIRPGRITLTFHPPINTENLNSQNMDEFIKQTHNIIMSGL